MMNKGVISEEDLLSFMRKKKKIKMKKERSLRWKNIPTTPKTQEKTISSCSRCYLLGHKRNSCKEDLIKVLPEELNKRKKMRKEEQLKRKRAYNKRYAERRSMIQK